MSKEKIRKEIIDLCQSILNSDLDTQASLMIHKMGKVYNQLLAFNYLNLHEKELSELKEEIAVLNEQLEEERLKSQKLKVESDRGQERRNQKLGVSGADSGAVNPDKKELNNRDKQNLGSSDNSEKHSIYEQLASKKRLSIGLNDKFAFIRDLFHGNSEDFKKVVDKINTFDSVEEAKSYITMEVALEHDWNEEMEETIQRFLDIIERRVS